MSTLQKLTQLSPKDESTSKVEKLNNDDFNEEVINNRYLQYFQQGYGDAKGAMGNPTTLSTCLENVYAKFKQKCRADDDEQNGLRKPIEEEKTKLDSQLAVKNTALEIKTELLEKKDIEIQRKKLDISNVKVQPEDYGVDIDKRPKAQFYIGLIILFFITIYLLVFYVSASYSSFFKDFDSTVLGAAIFDGAAFAKAFQDGWLEGVFVVTLPFVFMGIGYLIHMFSNQEKKSSQTKPKIILLFVITFLFDVILAYLIEKKIYDFERTLDSDPFNLQIAVGQAEFWGIIFAGFLVYIIWGLVLDFVLKEYENLDKLQIFIKAKREEIKSLEKSKDEVHGFIQVLKTEITEVEGQIKELQLKLNGFIFPYRKYKLFHSEYVKGWFMAINKEIALPHKEMGILIEKCKATSDDHLKSYDLFETGAENKLYING